MSGFHRYVGVVHVHTAFSDGTGDIEEVIAVARAVGLDFIVITDHNDLRAKGYEGWHGDTLVLAGEEVTRPGGNHMLALGIEEFIPPELSPQEAIDAAKAQGGLAFLAHPFYRGSPINGDPPLPWRDWDVVGFDGIEVWNLTSDLYQSLGERGTESPPRDPLVYASPNPEALRKWDELLARGYTVGLGGLDAHAERVARWGNEVILPYDKSFRALRLHLFLREPLKKDLEHDRDLIYNGLASGNFAIVFDWIGDGRDAFLRADCCGKAFLPGETIGWEGAHIRGEFPQGTWIRLVSGGEEVWRGEGSMEFEIDAYGIYRLEAFRDDRIWILFNPFYCLPEGGGGRERIYSLRKTFRR